MPSIASPVDSARISYTDYRPPKSTSPETKPFNPVNPLTTTATTPSIPQNFTLFFIHGWPMSAEMYTPLMLAFSQNHHIRCVAPDRRGFGRSEWSGSTGTGEYVTYDTFAKDTLAVIEAARIEGPWAFVGASMGCGESLLVCKLLEEGLRKSVSLERRGCLVMKLTDTVQRVHLAGSEPAVPPAVREQPDRPATRAVGLDLAGDTGRPCGVRQGGYPWGVWYQERGGRGRWDRKCFHSST